MESEHREDIRCSTKRTLTFISEKNNLETYNESSHSLCPKELRHPLPSVNVTWSAPHRTRTNDGHQIPENDEKKTRSKLNVSSNNAHKH